VSSWRPSRFLGGLGAQSARTRDWPLHIELMRSLIVERWESFSLSVSKNMWGSNSQWVVNGRMLFDLAIGRNGRLAYREGGEQDR
jgi:hypothetical protein